MDIAYGAAVNQALSNKYATATQTALQEAYNLVRQKLDMAHSFQKTYYDKRVQGNPFKEGDFVWLFSAAVPRGYSKKLHPWSGPHRIPAKHSEVTIASKRLLAGRLSVLYTLTDSSPATLALI